MKQADEPLGFRKGVPGRFSIEKECIFCTLCSEIAPEMIQPDFEAGYSYVYRQPSTRHEIDLCIEAMRACPVNAIKDEGGH